MKALVQMGGGEVQNVCNRMLINDITFGKEFDPNCHQAVGMVENKEIPDNHVAEELLTGYFLHERIIRPTMVRVSGKE